MFSQHFQNVISMHFIFICLFNSDLSFHFFSNECVIFFSLIIKYCADSALMPSLSKILQLWLLNHILTHDSFCNLNIIDFLLVWTLKTHFLVVLGLWKDTTFGLKGPQFSFAVVIDEMLFI